MAKAMWRRHGDAQMVVNAHRRLRAWRLVESERPRFLLGLASLVALREVDC